MGPITAIYMYITDGRIETDGALPVTFSHRKSCIATEVEIIP